MSDSKDVTEDLGLVERVRQVGFFEDWRARPAARLELPEMVLARRIRLDDAHPKRAGLEARLTRASALTDAVGGTHILAAGGIFQSGSEVIQVSADVDGVDIEQSPVSERRALPLNSAVWVGAQILQGLDHAHGRDVTHGALDGHAVWLQRNGEVMLDFGLATTTPQEQAETTSHVDLRFAHPLWEMEDGYHPKRDVYAAVALTWWLLVGRPYRLGPTDTERPLSAYMKDAPESLVAWFDDGLGVDPNHVPEAGGLAERLLRIFYRELGGDDHLHGQAGVAEYVGPKVRRDESQEIISVESIQGSLTWLPGRGGLSPDTQPTPLSGSDMLDPPTVLQDHWKGPAPGEDGTTEPPPAPPPPVSLRSKPVGSDDDQTDAASPAEVVTDGASTDAPGLDPTLLPVTGASAPTHPSPLPRLEIGEPSETKSPEPIPLAVSVSHPGEPAPASATVPLTAKPAASPSASPAPPAIAESPSKAELRREAQLSWAVRLVFFVLGLGLAALLAMQGAS